MGHETSYAGTTHDERQREFEAVRRHSGQVAWPTVALCAALVAADAAVVVVGLRGTIPLAAGTAMVTVLAYAFYTVHHEANHRAISGRIERWRWLDTVCGSIAAVPLTLSFRGYSAVHLQHHAATNDPGRDPDAVMDGPAWAVVPKWLLTNLISLLLVLPWGDRLVALLTAPITPADRPPPSEREQLAGRRLARYWRISTLVLLATIPFGWFVPALLLWWLPARLAMLLLNFLFQWLPHFPYDRTDRFGNTRITRFPGSTVLLFEQDHHLVHHLYPTVPWYRYHRVFRELRPVFDAHGARIEGRDGDGPITWTR